MPQEDDMESLSEYSKLKVLLAEDDSFLRRIATRMIQSLGTESVMEASDGYDAELMLDKHDFDLLITDVEMPEQNGVQLIKQIRTGATQNPRDLRVIVLTNFSNTEVLQACLALDVNGFLVKPISPASTAKKIQLAMKERFQLKPEKDYLKVNTELSSIYGTQESKRKVNAAVIIEPTASSAKVEDAQQRTAISSLRPGMKLMEDIFAQNGVKLVSRGQVLSESMINRIRELSGILATVVVDEAS